MNDIQFSSLPLTLVRRFDSVNIGDKVLINRNDALNIDPMFWDLQQKAIIDRAVSLEAELRTVETADGFEMDFFKP